MSYALYYIIYYTQPTIDNQPTTYGQLINLPADSNGEATQIWIDQPDGRVRYRGGNTSVSINATKFKTVATVDEVNSVTHDVNAREKVNSHGIQWVRYESGLQMCWNTSIGGGSWWSFPVAFASTPAVTLTSRYSNNNPWVGDLSNTGCSNKSDVEACAIAIGRWK